MTYINISKWEWKSLTHFQTTNVLHKKLLKGQMNNLKILQNIEIISILTNTVVLKIQLIIQVYWGCEKIKKNEKRLKKDREKCNRMKTIFPSLKWAIVMSSIVTNFISLQRLLKKFGTVAWHLIIIKVECKSTLFKEQKWKTLKENLF